jgi:hypothetical protein
LSWTEDLPPIGDGFVSAKDEREGFKRRAKTIIAKKLFFMLLKTHATMTFSNGVGFRTQPDKIKHKLL